MNWKYSCEGGEAGGLNVYVNKMGVIRSLKHHLRHSPDGFQIGYSGSGPTELARCILIDYFEKNGVNIDEAKKKAEPLYQYFKLEFIATQKESL